MSTASKRASARKTYRTEWVDRWSPPKPLVGLQAIEKVLNRHTFLVCPESRLVVAVLARAIHDSLCLTNRRMRREARRFLLGDDLTLWCDLVGLPVGPSAIPRSTKSRKPRSTSWVQPRPSGTTWMPPAT